MINQIKLFTSIKDIVITLNNMKALIPGYIPSVFNKRFYTFYGLDEDISDEPTLQDFSGKGNQCSPIQFLWVAPGNKLYPNILKDQNNDSYLHIEFDNQDRETNKNQEGSNIAIRLAGNQAHRKKNNKYLTFELRVPKNKRNVKNENIVLAFRIVNGWHQHWQYINSKNRIEDKLVTTLILKDFFQSERASDEWKSFSLNIDDDKKWRLFKGDGNYLYGPKKADFSIITSIIFEFGSLPDEEEIKDKDKDGETSSYNPEERPWAGKGELEIKNIKLSKEPEGYFIK